MGEWYSVKEAAEIVKVSSDTILRAITEIELKASKVGRAWRIKEEDLQTYLEENSNIKAETKKT